MAVTTEDKKWVRVIKASSPIFDLQLKQLWCYRDLVFLFIKRDIVVKYKQTILGPLWYIIQPILTSVVFTVIFGKVAKIPTDGIPPMLFYLSGLVLWTYFSQVLIVNSKTFISNQGLFGKVYFPRIAVPVSIIISNFVKFLIQFAILIGFMIYYYAIGATIHLTVYAFYIPLLVVLIAGLSLGFGLLFSSFTTKYRDLSFLLAFGLQLWMYATPIIYPLSTLSPEHQWKLALNPVTGIISAFKFALLGRGIFNWYYLLYSFVFMVILFFIGLILFNRVEKNFMDTV
jgi:lipopolysaccharide transport system permease protein